VAEMVNTAARRTVGLADVPRALVSPRRVFARVEDVPAWGWPLVALLVAVTLIGYATVETGLIDREVERHVRERIAVIDATQRDVVERSELSELYEAERKKGEFEKLLTRIRVIGAEPVRTLGTVLLIAALLYGVVALTGRKPEWHTLLTICVFAMFVEVLRLAVQLGLMLHYGSLDVYTSLTPLARLLVHRQGIEPQLVVAAAAALGAFDPFRIWFWIMIVIGLSATAQLPGWRAWLVCSLCWLIAAGVRCGVAIAAFQSVVRAAGPPG
jgi:hypothetical protein